MLQICRGFRISFSPGSPAVTIWRFEIAVDPGLTSHRIYLHRIERELHHPQVTANHRLGECCHLFRIPCVCAVYRRVPRDRREGSGVKRQRQRIDVLHEIEVERAQFQMRASLVWNLAEPRDLRERRTRFGG